MLEVRLIRTVGLNRGFLELDPPASTQGCLSLTDLEARGFLSIDPPPDLAFLASARRTQPGPFGWVNGLLVWAPYTERSPMRVLHNPIGAPPAPPFFGRRLLLVDAHNGDHLWNIGGGHYELPLEGVTQVRAGAWRGIPKGWRRARSSAS